MRTNYSRQKKLFTLLAVALTSVLLCFVLVFATPSVATPAHAITDEPYYANGASLDFVIDTNTYATTYDNVFTFDSIPSESGGKYLFGNMYSEQNNLNVVRYPENTGQGFAITTTVANTAEWYIDLEIASDSNLADAMRDSLVTVTLKPYFVWGSVPADGGSETGSAYLYFYDGTLDSSDDPFFDYTRESITYASTPSDNNDIKEFCSYVLPNRYGTDSPVFVRIKLTDFTLGGNRFYTAIQRMGIKVTCAFNNALAFTTDPLTNQTPNKEIIDSLNMRSPEAKENIVKGGDIIVMRTEIRTDTSPVPLNTFDAGVDPDPTAAENSPLHPNNFVYNGYFYRKLFMHGQSGYLLQYGADKETHIAPSLMYKQIFQYTDSNGVAHDLTDDYSGTVAAFQVQSTNRSRLSLPTTLDSVDGVTNSLSKTDVLYVDDTPASQPYLDSTNTFYTKYIANRQFYTDETGYKYQSVDKENNGSFVDTVVAVDIGKSAIRPEFGADALAIRGGDASVGFYGCSQITYYKVTMIENVPSGSGTKSTGFTPAEADGVYCTVFVADNGNTNAVYGELNLSLVEELPGGNVYHDIAYYSIEFITVDYVGNTNFCPQKFYIKVDISDYVFTYEKYINTNVGDTSVSDTDVQVRFAKYDDNNNLSASFESPVFKRGDRVVVVVSFTSTGYQRYVMTSFRTTGVSISTTNNEYDSSRRTQIMQSSVTRYTFEVNSVFSENEALRKFTLTFKYRATLSVSNKTQSYNGTGRSLTVLIKDSSNNTITGNVGITYSSTLEGPYSTTLPIDAGEYYYKCELLNHRTYYGYTSSMIEGNEYSASKFVIKPADTNVTDVSISQINYGVGLAERDFNPTSYPQDFNQSILAQCADGLPHYDRSSDSKGMYYINGEYVDLGCVFGYYMLSDIDTTSNTYRNPPAGTVSLTVKFVPIRMEYDEGAAEYVPMRDIMGRFIEDTNYSSVKITNVVLVVNHSTAVSYAVTGLDGENTVTYNYDGEAKVVPYAVTSTLSTEIGTDITEYTQLTFQEVLDEGYGEVTTVPPVDAGNYLVKIIILSSRCNYTGEKSFNMVVNKRLLNVEGYESATEFRFQEEQALTPTASYGDYIEDKIYYVGLNYKFTYYFHDGGTNIATSAIPENLVDEAEIYAGTGMPENAGTYVVKIEIDERNFANAATKYAKFTINQANLSYSTLTLIAPTLAYNSTARDAHLNYLQPLSYVKFSTNANTGVKFTYHVMVSGKNRTEIRSVTGYFILSYRTFRSAGFENETLDQFVEEVGSYDGYTVGRHTAYIYFIPTGTAVRNFLPVYRETEVTIGRAILLTNDVTVADIVYGTSVHSVTDLIISNNVKILLKTVDGVSTYKYLTYDDDDEGYTYSLESLLAANALYEAGEHYIDIKVTPNDTDCFAPYVFSLSLTVLQKELTVTFDTTGLQEGYYRYTYGGVNTPTPAFSAHVSLSGVTNYYIDSEHTEEATDLLAGHVYYATFTIRDKNYCGVGSYAIMVGKAKLKIDANNMPVVRNQSVTVAYNALMEDAVFDNGLMLSTNNNTVVRGTFAFKYASGTRFTATGARTQYFIKFTPNDTDNYEVYEDNDLYLYLTVAKADISSGITMNVESGFVYGDLYGSNNDADLMSRVTYTTPIWKSTTTPGLYSDSAGEGFEYLSASITFVDTPKSGKINAGSYPVYLNVVDDNYSGTYIGSLNIAPKAAKIVLAVDSNGESNEKIFRNRTQTVSYSLKTDDIFEEVITGETVTQTFYLGDNRLSSAPAGIGKYRAVLSLISNNYSASDLETNFIIKVDPSQIRITNLEQTYNRPRSIAVSLGLNEAIYVLTYVNTSTLEETSVMPTDAGQYALKFFFAAESNNGYTETIIYSENGVQRNLVINKFNATIVVADTITIDYTGASYDPRPTTEPYGLTVKAEYLAEGEEEYSDEEVLTANSSNGYHYIRFSVINDNFGGTKIVRYKIRPAALTIVAHPDFSTYTYNSDTLPTVLSRGRVDFGSIADLDGDYSIDITDINTLAVGTHSVPYTFTATKNGDPDGNYQPAVGNITLSITKRVIAAEDIHIGEVSGHTAYYNGATHAVDAGITDGLISDVVLADNSDFRIVVYYNGTINVPRDPGTYVITVEINSKNYSGEKTWEEDFVINKGIPSIIVPPTFQATSYAVDDTLTSDNLVLGSGRAVIAGTDTTISGEFGVVSAKLSRANYNQITLVFTPSDTGRFDSTSFIVLVFAVGAAPLDGVNEGENWDNKNITVSTLGTVQVVATSAVPVIYGSHLSAFTLQFVGDADAVSYMNSFGTLSFVDPDYVPEAGVSEVEISFYPYDEYAATYTITNGLISVTVEQATLTDYDVTLIGYCDKTIGEIEFIATDSQGNPIALNGVAEYYYEDELIDNDLVLIDELAGEDIMLRYVFTDNNYGILTGFATLYCVYELLDENVEVNNLTKSYDGQAINVEDLDIAVTNVAFSVRSEDIGIKVYDGENNVSDGIDIGTYKVVITVRNTLLYGEKTVYFTVTKRDISEEMTLDRYSTVYYSIVAPRAMLDGEYISSDYSIVIKYKAYSASDASYNVNVPTNAGDYKVMVTVDGDNYSGTKVFDFTVEKLAVSLVANSSYAYDYGSASIPSISFRYTDSNDGLDLDYDIYYFSTTYSMSLIVPTNAGTYTARVVLNEHNYSLLGSDYADLRYVINKMSTEITTLPAPVTVSDNNGSYNVKYGQSLRSLGLSGGEARRNDVPVAGYFTVSQPDLYPNAGSVSVQVSFIPYDANYAESTGSIMITVAKADVTVVFDKLRASYTGASCASAVRYTVDPSDVRIGITFVNSNGEELNNPVNAGSYTLKVVSLDNNYSIVSATDREGGNPIFVIAKASISRIVEPRTNDLTVGESLVKSSVISGSDFGLVYYVGFVDPIAGNFTFVDSSLTFTAAGTYSVDYKFTPINNANFDVGRGRTSITVNKASASITVSNYTFTYAEGFTYPTFTTYPAGLMVEHDISFREYDPNSSTYEYNAADYVDVGTYEFNVWVVDDNYRSDVTTFRIIIGKKTLDLDFINEYGNNVQQYVTTYGVTKDVFFKLYPSGTVGKRGYLLKDERVNGKNITDNYEIRFRSEQSGLSYDDHRAPSAIGTYSVTITLNNDNYVATKSILYKVERGIIENVYFDDDSRENQVYGSVTDPIITTVPPGVSYYIVYKGTEGNLLPTDAGSYNMTVYFDDPNYETKQVDAQFRIAKKPISIVNISVEDKVYDGVTTLKISGKLEGVLPGDEVNLTMTAETADGSAKVGAHYVNITSYTLSGLRAKNYSVVKPEYHQQIIIYENKVTASNSSSFITSATGFDEGTTVEFVTVASAKNASTFFENITGRSSTVIGFTVKENGADTLVKDSFKVYLAIPEEYLNSDFEVAGVGALEGKNIVFTREGNYITFYASSSGQVQFKKSEFRYETVVLVAAIGLAGIGLLMMLVLFPLQSRKKFSDNSAERAYAKRTRGGY